MEKSNNYKVAQELNTLARSLNVSPTALSIAWVLNHPAITAPIIGGRNAGQLLDSIQSLEIDMTVDLRKYFIIINCSSKCQSRSK